MVKGLSEGNIGKLGSNKKSSNVRLFKKLYIFPEYYNRVRYALMIWKIVKFNKSIKVRYNFYDPKGKSEGKYLNKGSLWYLLHFESAILLKLLEILNFKMEELIGIDTLSLLRMNEE